jgi:hypothetical protein
MPDSWYHHPPAATAVDSQQAGGITAWDGDTNTVWTADANWTTGTSAGNGDHAVFNAATTYTVAGADYGISVESIRIGAGHTDNFGTSSVNDFPIPVGVSANDVSIRKVKGFVSLKGTYTNIYIQKTAPIEYTLNTTTAARSRAAVVLGDSTITNLTIIESVGTVYIYDGTTITNLYLTPRKGGYVRLKVHSGATITNWRVSAGSFVTSAAGTGDLVVIGESELTFTDGAHADVLVAQGGLINHEAADNVTGTLRVESDGTFRTKDSTDTALTVATVDLYRNGVADFRARTRNLTVTNPVNCYGGVIRLDHGMTADV